jgi:hypothetical protein
MEKLVVLIIGNSRNIIQNNQNAVAIVRKFGKLDLFFTFIYNASLPDITTSIHSYETANNRSDFDVHVFHAKNEYFLNNHIKINDK